MRNRKTSARRSSAFVRRARAVCGVAAGVGVIFSAASAQIAAPAPIEREALARDAFATGLLRPGQGALEPTLWRGGDAATLSQLLAAAPARPATPSLGEVMRRVLLSAGTAPEPALGAAPTELGGRKLIALARAGFSEEARTIASLSSAPQNDSWIAEALATADLLDGDIQRACGRSAGLQDGRDRTFWVRLRVLCYARAGERDAADLTLGLLRDRGAMGEEDSVLLGAIATGASLKKPVGPRDALHLAALRQLNIALSPSLMRDADGGVLAAAARSGESDMATRIAAGTAAAAAGVMTADDLSGIFMAASFTPEEISKASERLTGAPGDPLTDVLLYQSVQQMQAPEFLRDKAVRIAEALSIADSFERAHAGALLYENDIKSLEGALLGPKQAAQFAEARMLVGDGAGAARWLYAMVGTGGLATMAEPDVMELIELTNFLALLDPVAAASVAETAGIALEAPHVSHGGAAATPENYEMLATLIDAAFAAAVDGVPGQAALSALAIAHSAPGDDKIVQVVVGQSLRAAGMADLKRRMDFEAAARRRFGAGEANADASGQNGFGPRLKPNQ